MDDTEQAQRAPDRRTLDGVKLLGSLDAGIRAGVASQCASGLNRRPGIVAG